MNKVITINLNGNAYQFEEPGYEALRTYLDKAAAALAGNPDKDEIVADFEQAIADKCAKYLGSNKNIITVHEADTLLAEMGPVRDGEAEAAQAAPQPAPTGAPKRLFRIRQGAMIEGICNGFAVYLNLDPTIVRILFVILTVLTGGAWAAAYIIMIFIIPEAKTREDIAKAQGRALNAQTLMQNAKERYEYWKKFGQEQKAQWGHRSDPKAATGNERQADAPAVKSMPTLQDVETWKQHRGHNAVLRTFAAIFSAAGVLLLLALVVLWILGIVHILNNGNILGYFQDANTALVALLYGCAFYLLFLPLQGLVGQAIHYAKNYPSVASFWATFITTIMWLAALGGIVAIVMYSPPIEEGLRQIKHDYERAGRIGR